MTTIIARVLAHLATLPVGPNYDAARAVASGVFTPAQLTTCTAMAVHETAVAAKACALAMRVHEGASVAILRASLRMSESTPTRKQRLGAAIDSGKVAAANNAARTKAIAALSAELAAKQAELDSLLGK